MPLVLPLPLILQFSETISTLLTLKVFDMALEFDSVLVAPVLLAPFSQLPLTFTSCPTCADTSCPVRGMLPFLVSRTYCPACDSTHPFRVFPELSLFSLGAVWPVCAEGEVWSGVWPGWVAPGCCCWELGD